MGALNPNRIWDRAAYVASTALAAGWFWARRAVSGVSRPVLRAFGYRTTPTEQMSLSALLAGIIIVLSIGTLAPLALLLVVSFAIGAARHLPLVNQFWPFSPEGNRR